MKKYIWTTTLIIATVLLYSCGGGEAGGNAEAAPATSETAAEESAPVKGQAFVDDGVSTKNILQIAISSADHSTLVAGVQATHLEDVLANNGPLTVFAPTNAAFDKLPEGTLENLLKDENLGTLKKIITNHAAPGTYQGKLLKDGQNLFMATGNNVKITREGEDVFVNGAKILGTVVASNGVVHVIDEILLPPEKK